MKILIIGGVAAGTKTAAKLKRENRDLDITILTKGRDISYAGCGLPYYVGDVIHEQSELIVNTPESFSKLTGVTVLTGREVTCVNRGEKNVTARNVDSGEEAVYSYDKLVIATGADPIKPPIEGANLEGVYYMRTPDDAVALREAVDAGKVTRAVIVGGGPIGLEVAENLASKGARVSVLDMAPQLLPGFDIEMADYVERHLAEHGIMAFTGTRLEAILGDGKVEKVKTDRRAMKADTVVLSIGIRANTAFLADTGLELMPNRTLKVDEQFRTNDPDIYAVGDCAMVFNSITGQPAWAPMGSSANIEGRMLAQVINGAELSYRGVLGTGVTKLPELNTGKTGLTEAAARAAGYDVETVTTVLDDKAHYYPGSNLFITKMTADKATGKLLGLQVLGKGAVDKMVDIAVTALSLKASVADLVDMDFAYAPPFSTAIHPIAQTANILLNKMNGNLVSITPAQFKETKAEGYRRISTAVTPLGHGMPHVDVKTLTEPIPGIDKDEKILLVCNKGKQAYLVQNRLMHMGYTNTLVLEGGTIFNNIFEEE